MTSPDPTAPRQSLLKFQIGPVQDFIAQARSTRDLWSGSYLLSWLTAAGIRELLASEGASLIFPAREGQLLLDLEKSKGGDHADLLTPNLPNLFVARVPSENAGVLGEKVKVAIEAEWLRIAEAVWGHEKLRDEIGLHQTQGKRFSAQVDRHLSISWIVTPEAGDYAVDYANNGWHLDAVRQTREFGAWDSAVPRDKPQKARFEKDSLSGREEEVMRGVPGRKGAYASLFKHDDYLGAVGVIKRVWHLAYLKEAHGLETGSRDFVIRSTRGIAARDWSKKANDDEDLGEAEKYLAAIAFDGDSIGKWVSGELLAESERTGRDLQVHHQRFSAALSKFAMKRARPIVEEDHDGFLIYAGGDDVVALVPADAALACAKALREAFCAETRTICGENEKTPDASAGIAIAHLKSPLQDLVREAQRAEKRAKSAVGRAFSVTLMKRSGEISQWGSKWDSGGLDFYEQISSFMRDGKLSAKFPHRVAQLLEPYLTVRSGLGGTVDADGFEAAATVRREFDHAVFRQSGGRIGAEQAEKLGAIFDRYLANISEERKIRLDGAAGLPGKKESEIQELLRSVLGLCATVAFAERNRSDADGPDDSTGLEVSSQLEPSVA